MGQTCAIRPMSLADAPVVARIESATSPHPWRESQFHESLERHHCYVMVGDDGVVGFMIYTLVGSESEILNIAVHPNFQGRGYGKELLDHLIDTVAKAAERLYLEVRVSNFRAIRLYQNAGFAELCVREGYYRTEHGREDAIMMALDLQAD